MGEYKLDSLNCKIEVLIDNMAGIDTRTMSFNYVEAD